MFKFKALSGLVVMLCVLLMPAALVAQPASLTPEAQTQSMRRGVNIIGYDPIWSDPASARFQQKHFKIIKDGGFDAVRVNLHAFAHMDGQNRLKPGYLKTLDGVVKGALDAGLTVILDQHNFNECAKDVPACRVKLKAFWTQISDVYKDAPPQVVFEILNEPNMAVDAVWNDMVAENLAVIRATNPTRNVIVGPESWNSLDKLSKLKLPEADRHLIVTFHYYTPMEFTHQGAPWTPGFKQLGVTWGSKGDRDQLEANFDKVAAWSKANGRPILLGEFGAYDKAPLASRIAYTEAVGRAAEARGFAWAYWQFDSDFVVYDVPADKWNAPIHGALIPEKASAAAPAKEEDDILKYLINSPQVSGWTVYGEGKTHALRQDKSSMVKTALKVTVPAPRPNPWDIGAAVAITGNIKKGDKLVFAVMARLDSKDPAAKAQIYTTIQQNEAPYTGITSGTITVTPEWDTLSFSGVASGDYPAGKANVGLHLGHLKGTIELGPVYVLNMGQ
ncbi:cellulase family glycosylhydrolase [Asticcacaulis machinosus]|uniref:Cellulase family glycosylhydrolase n=1 Tax=Asticcacaulis machinosus TaxID=2984211 RepID=A0ABT5HGX4_9CAUL|nr:cellulase family glycosylhydrolase [Asticcacaulis machinosus]MDC7675487.1 cellulase family glycosylhydrolase [Asticcacaulis machinosus]